MAESSPDGFITVRKGEIAHHEQFFSPVFSRVVQETHKIQGLFGKGLTPDYCSSCHGIHG